MTTLLLLFLFAFQQPIPIPADNSPDRTHKAKREQTAISRKDASGKTSACAVLVETKSGNWRVHLKNTSSQLFDTRAEALKWAQGACK